MDGLFSAFFSKLGREYSYGEGGGVVSSLPRNVLGVKYRETIEMGNTFLSPEQVKDVVHNLKVIYHGDNYNLISKYLSRDCLAIEIAMTSRMSFARSL